MIRKPTASPAPVLCREHPKLYAMNWRLENYDLTLLLLIPLYCFLIVQTGLPISWYLLGIFLKKSLQLLPIVYALSLPIILFKFIRLRRAYRNEKFSLLIREAGDPYLTLDYLYRTYRRIWVTLGSIFVFLHLKHLILWWNKSNYDLTLWNLDRALHFGVQPNIWAMMTFGDWDNAAILLDWLYIGYFKYKLAVAIFFLTEICGRTLADKFFFAYAMLWLFGGLAYLVFPADGPCYSVLGPYSLPNDHHGHIFAFPVTLDIPESYIQLYQSAKIWIAKGYQEHLWADRRAFLLGQSMPGVFYGVAAMPSLHNAAVVMISIFIFQVSSLAGWLSLIYVALIFLGSIFLQWHYAVDGYVGASFAIIISYIALKLPPLTELYRKRENDPKIDNP